MLTTKARSLFLAEELVLGIDTIDYIALPVLVFLIGNLIWEKLRSRGQVSGCGSCPLYRSEERKMGYLRDIQDVVDKISTDVTTIKARINGRQ
jgi:hypothetical protein